MPICFELRTGAACAQLITSVRSCATWGATLEQVLPNGTKACRAFGLDDKAEMEDFVMAFDSNMKPIVGQQVTLTASSGPVARARLALLLARTDEGDCDLVAHSSDRPRRGRPARQERSALASVCNAPAMKVKEAGRRSMWSLSAART